MSPHTLPQIPVEKKSVLQLSPLAMVPLLHWYGRADCPSEGQLRNAAINAVTQ